MRDEVRQKAVSRRQKAANISADAAFRLLPAAFFSFIPHPSSFILWLLVHVSRFGLAALFLFTAGAKLYTAHDFAGNVANLVPAGWAWSVTYAVIAVELLIAVLLLVPRTTRLGGGCAAALLLGFAGYALYYVYVLKGEPLECGCFGGIIASQLGLSTALRNLALLVPAALIIFGLPRIRRTESTTPEPQQSSSPA